MRAGSIAIASAAAVIGGIIVIASPAHADSTVTTVHPLAQAAPTVRFLDSIGINTHWEYQDTPYWQAYERVRGLLIESGIRHVRDGWNSRIGDLASRDIWTDVITDPKETPLEELHAKVRTLLGFGGIDAIEGPNEPDLFWRHSGKTYQGQGFPVGAVAFQRQLYRLFKSDPDTASLPIIGFSLGSTFDPGAGKPNPFALGELKDVVDWGNLHPYPFNGNPFSDKIAYGTLNNLYADGNFPSVNLDRFPFARSIYASPYSPKPMVSTETGYPTSPAGTSEAQQAKYVPRLFAEYFRLGIKRTYLYSLIDDDPNSQNGTFGIVRHDLEPKPAYHAVTSLMATLRSEAASSGDPLPASPTQSITVRSRGRDEFSDPSFVHSLLLRDGRDRYTLLLWHEASGEDRSVTPHRPIAVPELPAEIELPKTAHGLVGRRYDRDWKLAAFSMAPGDTKIDVLVPDSLVLLSFVCEAASDQARSVREVGR